MFFSLLEITLVLFYAGLFNIVSSCVHVKIFFSKVESGLDSEINFSGVGRFIKFHWHIGSSLTLYQSAQYESVVLSGALMAV